MALTEIKTSGIADDAVTTDKLANAINTARDANTAKATNATHTGDVTGSGSLTIADNAVTLAKMAGGTDGQIITYDASGDPVAVGPGTDGQVLTSTGAGSPPAFEAIPAQTPEGTAVLSTGESGGTKFLREDGDGTSSWQTVSAGTALTGSTNNTITTVTGANAIQGEANLTFDGDHVTQIIDADAEGFNQTAAGNHYIDNFASANRTSANGVIWRQTADWNGKTVAQIKLAAGTDTTNKDDGQITFWTSAANDNDERMKIGSDGDVTIKDGDLVIGTSGHGISFAATANGGVSTPHELFDDYEEGTWTPISDNDATYYSQLGSYTKIGRFVFVFFNFQINQINSGSTNSMFGLPFPVSPHQGFGQHGYFANLSTSVRSLIPYAEGSTKVMFHTITTSDAFSLNQNIFQNGSRVDGSICYQTSS